MNQNNVIDLASSPVRSRDATESDAQDRIPLTQTGGSECSICFDKYTTGGEKRCVVTPCGHVFCFQCIQMSVRIQRKDAACPKCRYKFNPKNILSQLVTLFDMNIVVVSSPAYENTILQLKAQVKESESKLASLQQDYQIMRASLASLTPISSTSSSKSSVSIHLP